jgi:hypothetical protein
LENFSLRKAGSTDTALRRLTAPPGKRIRHSDWPASPLEIQVSPTNKSWTSRPRINGRHEKLTYGTYPAMSLARASYDQLADLRRIDRLSAIKLATRNKWQRRRNNTGQMQVLVPTDLV